MAALTANPGTCGTRPLAQQTRTYRHRDLPIHQPPESGDLHALLRARLPRPRRSESAGRSAPTRPAAATNMTTICEGQRAEPHDRQRAGLGRSPHFLSAAPGTLAPGSNGTLGRKRGRGWHMTDGPEAHADPHSRRWESCAVGDRTLRIMGNRVADRGVRARSRRRRAGAARAR